MGGRLPAISSISSLSLEESSLTSRLMLALTAFPKPVSRPLVSQNTESSMSKLESESGCIETPKLLLSEQVLEGLVTEPTLERETRTDKDDLLLGLGLWAEVPRVMEFILTCCKGCL